MKCGIMLTMLINQFGCLLNYFESPYFAYLQDGNVKNTERILLNFQQHPY